MPFLKKEWKMILILLWLVVITFFLYRINDHVERINAQNAKIASTLDSVESVVLSTDSTVAQMGKRMGATESNVDFIVQKIRRR
jgi:lipopolysaccharide export system protein LptC